MLIFHEMEAAMGYMSIKQTSEKWNLSHRWINDLCVEGRIPEAVKIGPYWAIPEDAKSQKMPGLKPADISNKSRAQCDGYTDTLR